MSSSFSLSMFISLLFLFSLSCNSVTHASTSAHRVLCNDNESSALLQFKESFKINRSASGDPSTYPKVESWNLTEQSDCCFWDGVECDKLTGHVIGLHLNSSCLYGSINYNSSLFKLGQLQYLNLADNNFNFSSIPFTLARLSQLTYLDLSGSAFSGHIPSNILELSKLSFLDLSNNQNLVLRKPDFFNLVQNLTMIEYLHLDMVEIFSKVPEALVNLTSLKSIILSSCGLHGQFPEQVFQLPNLQNIVLSSNRALKGHLPDFNLSSPLQALESSHTKFSGELPASIGNLGSLSVLNLWNCSFSGHIPTSLGNLTQLFYLSLSENNFEVQNSSSLSWVSKLSGLITLGLAKINLNGEIPSYFANLTLLAGLFVSNCQISSPIPTWLMNVTLLSNLDLSFNQLQGQIPESISQLRHMYDLKLFANSLEGPIPSSIFQLENLGSLDLGFNNLTGVVELEMFRTLRMLTILVLSGNKLSLVTKIDANATLQKFQFLGLASCNLVQFPHFLRDENDLRWLDLSSNSIHGLIPKWLWDATKDTLEYINLSDNFLTGFELHPTLLPWTQVSYIDLSSNMLQGSLPIPPLSTKAYRIAGNNLTGEISPQFCSLNSVYSLEFSDNNLSGLLPRCFLNFSASLELLALRSNNFHGTIPETLTSNCNLKWLILDYNNFEGQIPRSLANCTSLQILLLGNNQIKDVFPSSLGSLPELKVLVLRSNQFQGELLPLKSNSEFPKLQIIDLSQNNLTGQLPTQYFLDWNAMKTVNADKLTYMHDFLKYDLSQDYQANAMFWYSLVLMNKGMQLTYIRVLDFFVAIDLSGNRIEGDIPDVIGNLKGLGLLNLSNNLLTGQMPSSIANLSNLESLDLSQNHLSGEIPQDLAQLNFLAAFNVSYNNLTGPIPKGGQFNTFKDNSYIGNSGLCGNLLSRKCESSQASPPSPSSSDEKEESSSALEFGWKPILIGYGSGLIVGLVIGQIVITWKYDWFLKTFSVIQPRMKIVKIRRLWSRSF